MQQPETVGHVDAIFGGKPVRFELARDAASLLSLELQVGSLRGLLGRFQEGTWLMSDVRAILARAHPVTGGMSLGYERKPFQSFRAAQLMAALPLPQKGVDPLQIDGTLGAAPPITYALLAARVLEAMLYGIEPARAAWDERQPAGPPEEAAA